MRTMLTGLLLATISGGAVAMMQDMGPMRGGMGAIMRADADHDGTITRDEVLAEADTRFARQDTDGDGKITAAERQAERDRMRQRMAARGGDMPPPPGMADGPRGGIGTGRGMGGGREMSRGADPDGDGAITRDEFRAQAVRRFDRMDLNHDGRIDQAEIAQIGQRMRAMGGDMPPPPGPPIPPAPSAAPQP